jgi:hypothetical protein
VITHQNFVKSVDAEPIYIDLYPHAYVSDALKRMTGEIIIIPGFEPLYHQSMRTYMIKRYIFHY